MCAAAVTLANRGDARAIVAVTTGGSTARQLSALRPRAPIFAATARVDTARRLLLHESARHRKVSDVAFTAGFKPALHVTELAAGQKVAGKIAFDVPKAALAGGRIQIDGIGFDYDKPAAYWAL